MRGGKEGVERQRDESGCEGGEGHLNTVYTWHGVISEQI